MSLTVLMLLVLGAGCYIRREHSIKLREMEEKRHLWQAKEEARQTKEKALQDRGEAGQQPRLARVAACARGTGRPQGRVQGSREIQGPWPRAGVWGDPGSRGGSDGWSWNFTQVTYRVVFCCCCCFGHACGMQMFPGQGLHQHHSSNSSCCSDSTGSLTC